MSDERTDANRVGAVRGHTPGPWEVWRGYQYEGGGEDLCIGAGEEWLANMDHRQRRCQQINDDGHFEATCDICTIDSGDITAEQVANAYLIAAAPDLLAACEVLAEWLEHEDAGPQYPEGVMRDTPEGERVWQKWWNTNQYLCGRALKEARLAIARATPPADTPAAPETREPERVYPPLPGLLGKYARGEAGMLHGKVVEKESPSEAMRKAFPTKQQYGPFDIPAAPLDAGEPPDHEGFMEARAPGLRAMREQLREREARPSPLAERVPLPEPGTFGACYDCGRRYGDKFGFPDLVVPHEVWAQISPRGDEGGLLCPSCMVKRAAAIGLENVPATFRSGPFAALLRDAPEGEREIERAIFLAAQRHDVDAHTAMHVAASALPEVASALQGLVVCKTCGNKRCPGVNGNPCTGSNEPGQPGSNYEHVPPFGSGSASVANAEARAPRMESGQASLTVPLSPDRSTQTEQSSEPADRDYDNRDYQPAEPVASLVKELGRKADQYESVGWFATAKALRDTVATLSEGEPDAEFEELRQIGSRGLRRTLDRLSVASLVERLRKMRDFCHSRHMRGVDCDAVIAEVTRAAEREREQLMYIREICERKWPSAEANMTIIYAYVCRALALPPVESEAGPPMNESEGNK